MELLAPAGNYESFLGAIHAGADAVYLGGDKFGARAYADNFSKEEICMAISYAHVFGKKVYLTVNTLIKDSELPELIPYIEPFYHAGLDGVIVQDMGALITIREAFPGLELHASTQMTLTGAYGVDFLKDLGVVRIVPARELSLDEMKEIKEKTGLEVEAFIHGAMCYCYSGQCLFSSILGGRSGNRGRCAQPCRLPYQTNGKEAYPLSLKDMCTIAFIPQLIEAGIDSFKIEGRMKKPEYAAGVTAIYRKYIDLYYEKGAAGYKVAKEDLEKLSSLYIRSQIQDGYYFKHNGADMVTLQSPAYNGSDEKLLRSIREQYIDTPLKKKVQMQASFKIGEEANLTVFCGEKEITVKGQPVEPASKQPVSRENIIAGLFKLGNTPFFAEQNDISITMDEGIFYPLKAINDLRRKAVDALLASFVGYERTSSRIEEQPGEVKGLKNTFVAKNTFITDNKPASFSVSRNYRIMVSSEEQLHAFLKSGMKAEVLYLEFGLLKKDGLLQSCKDKFAKQGMNEKLFVALPYILRKKDYSKITAMFSKLDMADGVLVRNLESYKLLCDHNYEKEIITDAGMYVFNKPTLAFWQKKTDACCLPYELNKKELRKLLEGADETRTEQVAFGRIPLMVTANCVAKTTASCAPSDKPRLFSLKDRYRKDFPVLTVCDFCYNLIYNAVPLSLHEKVQNSDYAGAWRLSFTIENEKETTEILRFFDKVQKRTAEMPPYKEYTLGHEKRGVE